MIRRPEAAVNQALRALELPQRCLAAGRLLVQNCGEANVRAGSLARELEIYCALGKSSPNETVLR